jgi:DNA-binding NarL/FixJ family response regulator
VSTVIGRQAAAKSTQGNDGAIGGHSAARILVVEDDYFIAMEIEATLVAAGYEVVGIAATAAEAAEMAGAHHPDMAVMDIRLREGPDGIDAAIELFKVMGIRSLFATAHEDAETRRRAAVAKPLGWLAKPFSPPSLREAVRTAIAQLR